jgi:predicted lactoylglutathione lyase
LLWFLRGEPEIRSFHSISKKDIEKRSDRKKCSDLSIICRSENGSKNRRKQVVDKPSENAAKPVPDCLPRQFFYAAQRNWNVLANVLFAY